MPQLTLSNSIDAAFLAQLANLGKAWGSQANPDGTTQQFAFETIRFDAVEAAIEAYPLAYLEHAKTKKLEEIADIRRVKEIQGPMGLALDDKTVARLTAAATGLMIDQTMTGIQWEVTRGNFTTMPREIVLGLAVQAVRHVQACFTRVSVLTNLVKAVGLDHQIAPLEALEDSIEALDTLDINSGWPT